MEHHFERYFEIDRKLRITSTSLPSQLPLPDFSVLCKSIIPKKKKSRFPYSGGVLTVVGKDDNIYRMPSAFMDELMRRRVISDLYVSFPEVPIMVTRSLDNGI
ncbi:unnamed protein product [Rhizophagus irregularis]|nr:unnamed protein product [Rhizophagus irregularis]